MVSVSLKMVCLSSSLVLILCCLHVAHVSGQTNSTSSNSTIVSLVHLFTENSDGNKSYATKDEVATLSYSLSILQVVVIVNSTIVGLLILVVGALTSIKCFEDYDPDSGVRTEDPLWLKLFGIFNWFVGLLLCQCFEFAKPKGKKVELINTGKWREWHMKDLELQKGLVDELKEPNDNEERGSAEQ